MQQVECTENKISSREKKIRAHEQIYMKNDSEPDQNNWVGIRSRYLRGRTNRI